MKKIFLGLILGLVALSSPCQEISTYYLIRHAEKVITEDRNPDLTEKGYSRAQTWVNIFKDVKFDAVYSTDYIRTIKTAKPTAQDQGLEIQKYHPTKIDIEKFLKDTKGKTVLIVGHSNTTPTITNKLIGEKKYEFIEDDVFGNLYIVEIIGELKTSQLLHFE